MSTFDDILCDAESAFAAAATLPLLDQAMARFLGTSGAITEQMKGLGGLPPEQRKEAGARINQVKDGVEALLKARREAIQARDGASIGGRGNRRDPTWPFGGCRRVHPVSRTLRRIEQLFASIGFEVADGPEIETDCAVSAYCFALALLFSCSSAYCAMNKFTSAPCKTYPLRSVITSASDAFSYTSLKSP